MSDVIEISMLGIVVCCYWFFTESRWQSRKPQSLKPRFRRIPSSLQSCLFEMTASSEPPRAILGTVTAELHSFKVHLFKAVPRFHLDFHSLNLFPSNTGLQFLFSRSPILSLLQSCPLYIQSICVILNYSYARPPMKTSRRVLTQKAIQ